MMQRVRVHSNAQKWCHPTFNCTEMSWKLTGRLVTINFMIINKHSNFKHESATFHHYRIDPNLHFSEKSSCVLYAVKKIKSSESCRSKIGKLWRKMLLRRSPAEWNYLKSELYKCWWCIWSASSSPFDFFSEKFLRSSVFIAKQNKRRSDRRKLNFCRARNLRSSLKCVKERR